MADEEGEKPADQAPDATETSDAPDANAAPAPSTGDAPSAPKKKKKKKKKRAAEESVETKPTGPALGPEGWERPNFVLDFPKDEELERLVRAFELGNYARVREGAKKLATSAKDDDVRRAAGELLRRIEPDPLVKILFAMSLALFAFMVFYAYRSHGH